jgi:integrase
VSKIAGGIEQYISLRRAYGLKFECSATTLRQFGKFCRTKKHRTVTVSVVLDWIQTYPNSTSKSISRRVRDVRGFTSYWKAYDSKTEIPPRDLCSEGSQRAKPYIFSPHEITLVMKACRSFGAEPGQSNPIRCQTFSTIFGLIAAAGLRRSEAYNLKRSHVDLGRGTILIEMTKFRKSRLIPIHPTTVAKLRDYTRFRDRVIPDPRCDRFFVMNRGQPVDHDSIYYAFVRACKGAGLRPTSTGAGFPRLHDLRHTFAVHTILKWLRQGKDVHALMPALSTYMGHAQPSDTYWYLSGVPELLRFALAGSGRL